MKQQWRNEEIAILCQEIGLFLHAGMDLGGGLFLLAEEASDPTQKQLLQDTANQVDTGIPLGAAMQETHCFPEYFCSFVTVGERTGHLEQALNALARYYRASAQMDRYLRTALLYPMVLLLVLLVVLIVLLTKVLPIFDHVYASLGGQLTGLAGALLIFGQRLDAGMPLLVALLVLAIVLLGAFAGSDRFRAWLLRCWRRQRGSRGVCGALGKAHFAQSLSMALEGGLSGQESLTLAATLLTDQPQLAQRCQACCQQLDQGISLAKALDAEHLLSPSDCHLLELGQRSGCLETVAAQIAQQMTEAGEAAVESRLAQIEPALVLVASLLVGIVLLSVMLPLTNILSMIG